MLWIGLDEAGYGPTLGPLVIGCAVWRVPDGTAPAALPGLFKKLICAAQPTAAWLRFRAWQDKQKTAKRPSSPAAGIKKLPPLWLTDSKKIHQPGLPERLERAAWPLWELAHGHLPRAAAVRQLWLHAELPSDPQESLFADDTCCAAEPALAMAGSADGQASNRSDASESAIAVAELPPSTSGPPVLEPWDWNDHLSCPMHAERADLAPVTWYQQRLAERGLCLLELRVRVIMPCEYNAAVRRIANKSTLPSHATLGLLAGVLARFPGEAAYIEADKHGGRDTYAGLLARHWPQAEIVTHHESRAQSRYTLHDDACHTIHFSAHGESSLATAGASLAAKSVRELAMHGFNKYWRALRPELQPTAGYNNDAWRFLRDIADLRRDLGIDDERLIRSR